MFNVVRILVSHIRVCARRLEKESFKLGSFEKKKRERRRGIENKDPAWNQEFSARLAFRFACARIERIIGGFKRETASPNANVLNGRVFFHLDGGTNET